MSRSRQSDAPLPAPTPSGPSWLQGPAGILLNIVLAAGAVSAASYGLAGVALGVVESVIPIAMADDTPSTPGQPNGADAMDEQSRPDLGKGALFVVLGAAFGAGFAYTRGLRNG